MDVPTKDTAHTFPNRNPWRTPHPTRTKYGNQWPNPNRYIKTTGCRLSLQSLTTLHPLDSVRALAGTWVIVLKQQPISNQNRMDSPNYSGTGIIVNRMP